jgi:hypothetical protein
MAYAFGHLSFRSPPKRCTTLAVAGLWLAIGIAGSVRANDLAAPGFDRAAETTVDARDDGRSPEAPDAILDVALGPRGALQGRVVTSAGGETSAAGWLVVLLRDGRRAAETATDASGRFSVRNLAGGLYQVVAHTPAGTIWRFCRVWTNRAAPPHAQGELVLLAETRLVRAQGPLRRFPIMSFQQAATMAAVAGGAIAAPIIYHNARLDNRVPNSP